MKLCPLIIAFSLVIPVAGHAGNPALAGQGPPTSGQIVTAQPAAVRVAALVRDLGSGEFGKREKATRELVALGIVARDALERAARDSDAEVRVRARAILARVCATDFRDRLEAFSADYDGSHKHTLPAWEQFSSQYGASRVARQLFVEMQRAESELLAALAQGPKQGTDALAERTRQILEGDNEALSNLGTLAAVLFVGSADGVTVDEQGSLHLLPYAVQTMYQRHGRSPYWPIVLRKIVGHWITKDRTPETNTQNLFFAAQLELKEEGLAIATRVLSSDAQAGARPLAVLVAGRFGGKAVIPLLEKQLGDATNCGSLPTDKPPHSVELQVRDVALGVLLHITDQDPRQYGSVSSEPYGQGIYQLTMPAFAEAASRDAALQKWAQWRAEHPDS